MNRENIMKLISQRAYNYTLEEIIKETDIKVYDLILECVGFVDNNISKSKEKSNEMIIKLQTLDFNNELEVNKYETELNEMSSYFIKCYKYDGEKLKEKADKELTNMLKEMVTKAFKSGYDIRNNVIASRLAVEEHKLKSRFKDNVLSFEGITNDKIKSYLDDCNYIEDVITNKVLDIQDLQIKNQERILNENEILEEAVKRERYKKLFQGKEVFKLAESMGFVNVRQNGDHAIYEHKITNESLPIPDRTLSSRESYNIQKQLREKSILENVAKQLS